MKGKTQNDHYKENTSTRGGNYNSLYALPYMGGGIKVQYARGSNRFHHIQPHHGAIRKSGYVYELFCKNHAPGCDSQYHHLRSRRSASPLLL